MTGAISMQARSGEARSALFQFTGSDFSINKHAFTHYFGALALDDVGGIAEGTGGDCSTDECDVDALCSAGSASGNSTSRTGPAKPVR